MALDAFATGDGNMWRASGGDWFFDLNDSEQQEARVFVVEIPSPSTYYSATNDNIKYVIAHADYPGVNISLVKK